MRQQKIHDIIYRVAGPDMTDPRDSAVYLLDLGEPVLIDCGSGFAFDSVIQNIEGAGFDPAQIKNIILTHCSCGPYRRRASLQISFWITSFYARTRCGDR